MAPDPTTGVLPAPPTPMRRPAAVRPPWTSRLLEQASSYLPLLLMALLALGTWWLVTNTPVVTPPRPQAPARHEPDYTMTQFMVRRFAPDGAMRAQVEGATLRHFPDDDTVEIDHVRLRALDDAGIVTRAEARAARANGDGSEVQLMGGAHVVREGREGDPPLEFRGEFLHVFLDAERVRSHLPVTLARGGAELRGESLEYDHLQRVATLKGRVTAVFPPSPAR